MAFSIIPKLNSAPGAGAPATLTLGELAANRSTAKLYMGTDTGVQELAFAGSLGGTAISTFTAAGDTSFSPINGYTSTNVNAYLVSVGGIEQRPTVDWTISASLGGTVVFATAPPAGASIVVRAVVAGSGGSGGADIGGRAWSGTATYTEGDLVATDQTSTWICIQAENTGNDPATSPLWWARMPASAVQLQFRPLAETAPTDGQAIVWDDANTTWKPGTVSGGGGNATQLQSRDIATTAPTAGQVLAWNATTSKWEPTGGGGTITFNTVGTHYWYAPAWVSNVRLQMQGAAGTATTGTAGTAGTDGYFDEFGVPQLGVDGIDGEDGVPGTSGKGVRFNSVVITGGTAGGAGGKGLKGGGGGAPGDWQTSTQPTGGSAGGAGAGGGAATNAIDFSTPGTGGAGGNYQSITGEAGANGIFEGPGGAGGIGIDGAGDGGNGGDAAGLNNSSGGGGGAGVGTGGGGGGGAGSYWNSPGAGGKGGQPKAPTIGTPGGFPSAAIDRIETITPGQMCTIIISEGAGTASCTITW